MTRFFKHVRLLTVVGLATLVLGFVPSARAVVTTLTDQNSVVRIDSASQAGMFDWEVDGVDQMFQQWFWYRIGNTAEASIDTISAATLTPFLGTRGIEIAYSNASLAVAVTYLLTGGSPGGGGSDIAETIQITNRATTAQTISFFQYSDFDLGGTSGDDFQQFTSSTVAQVRGDTVLLSETSAIPAANGREGAFYPTTLLNLNDGVATNLGPNGGASAEIGPGDVTWAYQWTRTLAAGQSFTISKDKLLSAVVPEPGTLAMAALIAPVGIISVLRRRKKA
jgi:hypothetical protein